VQAISGCLSVICLGGAPASPAEAQLLMEKALPAEAAITHVLARSGKVLVAARGNGVPPHTMENSQRKGLYRPHLPHALGRVRAARQGQSTVSAVHLTGVIAAQSALPIKVGDEVIGAVGVSGTPGGEMDEACAKAGLDKVSDHLK
jgi:uncharacterized protein GlcG (DUF336 family)